MLNCYSKSESCDGFSLNIISFQRGLLSSSLVVYMVSHDICPHRCPWSRRPGCLSAAAPSPSEPPPRLRTLRRHSLRGQPRPAPPETWTKTQAHRPSSPSLPSSPFIHSRASASATERSGARWRTCQTPATVQRLMTTNVDRTRLTSLLLPVIVWMPVWYDAQCVYRVAYV